MREPVAREKNHRSQINQRNYLDLQNRDKPGNIGEIFLCVLVFVRSAGKTRNKQNKNKPTALRKNCILSRLIFYFYFFFILFLYEYVPFIHNRVQFILQVFNKAVYCIEVLGNCTFILAEEVGVPHIQISWSIAVKQSKLIQIIPKDFLRKPIKKKKKKWPILFPLHCLMRWSFWITYYYAG